MIRRKKENNVLINSEDKMEFIRSLDQRVKKLGFFNIQLVKISNWFFALIVLKLIPEILNIDTKWFVVLFVLFSLKPFYVGWLKDDKSGTNEHFTKKLGFVDLQLIKVANWFFAIIVVKYYPEILNIKIIWFVVLLVLFSIIPFYVAWLKNGKNALGST